MSGAHQCVFCDIVAGKVPCHKVWEDEGFLAFLSIFPNTKGLTVVIPKQHRSSYAFDLEPSELASLTLAAQKVAKILDEKFEDVGRTAMVYEGFGVDHVHAKLIPLHGTVQPSWKSINSHEKRYMEHYEGYIATYDSDRADDDELANLAQYLRG